MNLQLLKKKKVLDDGDEEDEDDDLPSMSSDEPEEQPETPAPQSKFSQLYSNAVNQPKGPANTKFGDFLDKGAPSRADFPTSKTNRLAAVLGGASEGFQRGASSGVKTAKDILDTPYERGMEKWNADEKSLEQGAALEDKGMGRAASFAKSAVQSENAERTAQNAADLVAVRAKHWNAQDQNTAAAAATKGFQHVVGADGHSYFQKPNADGTVQTLDGGKIGQSIPEKTAEALKLYSGKEAVRGTTQKDINADAETGREIGDNKRAGLKLETDKEHEADIAGRTAATPTMQNADAQLKMKKFLAANGKDAEQYFHMDANGNPTAIKAGDPSDADYQSIYKYVYGAKAKK